MEPLAKSGGQRTNPKMEVKVEMKDSVDISSE
jgi:hypothetical protein